MDGKLEKVDKRTEQERLLERKKREIELIKEVSGQINKTLDINSIAQTMLELMDKHFGFEHSMILTLDNNNESLSVLATHGYKDQGIGAKVRVGVGVIGMVAKRKKLMRMANMRMQMNYMHAVKKEVIKSNSDKIKETVPLPGLKDVESQIAIPMILDEELVGVFSVESQKLNLFDKEDELVITILANQTASALKHANLYKLEQERLNQLNKAHSELADLNQNLEKKVEERTSELVELSKKLAKYFSPQVYESIFSGKLDVTVKTQRKQLTVFFSDLQGFTELTERLEPEILTELLTDYLTEMSKIAIKWGGTIDKYIGDAMLVFFGDPSSNGHREDAINCVAMASEMIEKLSSIRNKWLNRGVSKTLNARIGIHSAVCTVGNFGSQDRLDYTVIGNGVNLASRLESNARANKILISEDTYLLIKESFACNEKETISVKGVSYPVKTYEVLEKKEASNVKTQPINKEMPGFSLKYNPSELSDNDTAIKLVSDLLKRLEKQKSHNE